MIRRLFLAFLALIYLTAFISLWVQIDGLIGSNGILPAKDLMALAREKIPGQWYRLPTLAWFSSSDLFLHGLCAGGTLLALLVVVGRPRVLIAPALFLLWLFYLSLTVVSQDFLSFQWDNLLLETGFLAIFFAGKDPSKVVLWLLRWLLFRLMFESGLVKFFSGDPTWRNLTALALHYETQPLPSFIGWYAHQLPLWFQKVSCAIMFIIELIVPFSIFGTRRIRLAGCGLLVFFQVLIFLTGNYCFFNLLTILLCVTLLNGKGPNFEAGGRGRWLRMAVAGIILTISTLQLAALFFGPRSLPLSFRKALQVAAPFRTVNRYGLFAVMTTQRREIVIEGSNDGKNWREYEFKYKPGDPAWMPRFVAPHQPRLDWQMWFAALERCGESPWFVNFLGHLRKGTPEVLKLLAVNPFSDGPPSQIRAVVYEYHFTGLARKRATGEWWQRELLGAYCP